MLAGITVIFTIIGTYFGFTQFLVPVPLAILVFRQGFKSGVIVAIVASLVTAMLFGSVLMAVQLIILGLMGIALGMALAEKFSITQTFVVGSIASIITLLLSVLSYSIIFGENLIEVYLATWSTTSEQWLAMLEQMGMNPEFIAQYEQTLELIPTLFTTLIPAGLIGAALLQTFVNLALIRIVIKRLGTQMAWISPLKQWRLPSWFSWGFVLAALLMFLPQYLPYQFIGVLGLNVFYCVFIAFLVQGIAICWFYFDKYKVNVLFRVIFVFMLFQISISAVVLSLGGAMDTWFNFRKLNVKENRGDGQ